MEDIDRYGIDWLVENLNKVSGDAYISLDIDVIDPTFAPGTGTREVGGFTSREIVGIIRSLARSGIELRGFDVVEVSPPLDHSGITSLLAANIIYEAMSVKAYHIMRSIKAS
jgi:agmatinase